MKIRLGGLRLTIAFKTHSLASCLSDISTRISREFLEG